MTMSAVLKGAGAIAVALFLAGFGIETLSVVPDNAVLYVDAEHRTYLSPPCVPPARRAALTTIRNRDVSQRRLAPDRECANAGGFVQPDRSVSGLLLERVGVLPHLASRWNPDGSWNW